MYHKMTHLNIHNTVTEYRKSMVNKHDIFTCNVEIESPKVF